MHFLHKTRREARREIISTKLILQENIIQGKVALDLGLDKHFSDVLIWHMMYDVYIGGDFMVRTQIYLTEEEKSALNSISIQVGKKQSELIREAVDELIARYSDSRRQEILDNTAGIWKDRDDLPDFATLRREWDRSTF